MHALWWEENKLGLVVQLLVDGSWWGGGAALPTFFKVLRPTFSKETITKDPSF